MPFIAINNGIIHKRPRLGLLLYVSQIGFMLYWGMYAFQLEFYGTNFFSTINGVNSGFFIINLVSMVIISRNHQLTITHEIEGKNVVKHHQNVKVE
jgi:hypothetical protein